MSILLLLIEIHDPGYDTCKNVRSTCSFYKPETLSNLQFYGDEVDLSLQNLLSEMKDITSTLKENLSLNEKASIDDDLEPIEVYFEDENYVKTNAELQALYYLKEYLGDYINNVDGIQVNDKGEINPSSIINVL